MGDPYPAVGEGHPDPLNQTHKGPEGWPPPPPHAINSGSTKISQNSMNLAHFSKFMTVHLFPPVDQEDGTSEYPGIYRLSKEILKIARFD